MGINSSDITYFVTFFIIGILIALAVHVFSRHFWGKFLKALFDNGACNEESAVKLSDIGYEKNFLIKYALSHKTTVSFIVGKVLSENKDNTKYYIPEEKSRKAEALYRADGLSLRSFVALIVVLVAVLLLCKYVVPYIFD